MKVTTHQLIIVVVLLSTQLAAITCAEIEKCIAPSGNSVNSVLQNVATFIPGPKVSSIVAEYIRTDLNARNLAEYLQSTEFHAAFAKLKRSNELRDAAVFACRMMHFDIVSTLEAARNSVDGIGNEIGLQETVENGNATGGIRGMVDAILKVLPLREIIKAIDSNLENDPYLMIAYGMVFTPQGHEIVEMLRNSGAVKEVAERIRQIGKVDFEEIGKDVFSAASQQVSS